MAHWLEDCSALRIMRLFALGLPVGFVLAFAPCALAQEALPAESPAGTATPAPAAAEPAQPEGAQPGVRTVVVKEKETDTATDLETGGLGLEWVYLNADMGVAYTDLVSLKASNWALQDNSAAGPAFGLGAGVRLLFISVGARVRDLQLSTFNLWETDLEAAFHFRIWRVDGYFGARGGYAFLGAFSAESVRTSTGSAASDVTVHGWNVGPTVGLDFYFSKRVSVGVDANAEFLFLERPALPLKPGQTVSPAFKGLYANSGSSVGAGFVGVAHLGIHF